jgi:hypothetical protein
METTNAGANTVEAVISASQGSGPTADEQGIAVGSLGAPIVSSQGLLVGLQNGRKFVSIKLVLVREVTIMPDDLTGYFLPAAGFGLKPFRLVDAGLSVASYRATCFIIYGKGDLFGTGFLCIWNGKRFIITNFHVLGLLKDASEAWLEFRALSPILRVKLDPSVVHLVDKFLDFALIAISEQSLQDLKFVEPLQLSSKEVLEEVSLQLLGYPFGWSSLFSCSYFVYRPVSAEEINRQNSRCLRRRTSQI